MEDKYTNEETNLNTRLDKILGIVFGDLGEEQDDDDKVKKLRKNWEKISQMKITQEIKDTVERETTEIIHKIQAFTKGSYKKEILRRKSLQVRQNVRESEDEQTTGKNSNVKPINSKKKERCTPCKTLIVITIAIILVGIGCSVWFFFVIRKRFKKRKKTMVYQ